MKDLAVLTRRAALLILGTIFLIGNLVFFFLYGTDTRGREQALEERRAALEKEVAAAEAEAARLAAQRDRLAQVSSALAEFYGRRIGPSRDTLAPLVDEVHALLRRADLSPSQISYQTAEVPELPLSEMTIAFGFQSDYAKFKKLLQLIEKSRHWILVREAALARDPESPASVDVRLTLATYFAAQTDRPKPPAPGRVGT
jgi:Tfp pilus assembly protein PilO